MASRLARWIALAKAFSASRLPTLFGNITQNCSNPAGEEPPLGGEGGLEEWGLGEGGVGEEPSGERRVSLALLSVTCDALLRL